MTPSKEYMDLRKKINPWINSDSKYLMRDECIKYGLKENAPEDVQQAFKEFVLSDKLRRLSYFIHTRTATEESELQKKVEPWINGDKNSHEYKHLDWDNFALICGLKEDAPEDVQHTYKELTEKIKQWQEVYKNYWPQPIYRGKGKYWDLDSC